MVIEEFIFGVSIGISITPVWFILVEIIDKFYQAFCRSLLDE